MNQRKQERAAYLQERRKCRRGVVRIAIRNNSRRKAPHHRQLGRPMLGQHFTLELDPDVAARPVEQMIDQLASQTGIIGALVLFEAAAGVLEESLRYGAHLAQLEPAAADEVVRMAREKGRELAGHFNTMSIELRASGSRSPPTAGGQG